MVVPAVLSPADVVSYRTALDADHAARPQDWQLSHTHSRGVGPELLSRTTAFDRVASLRDSPCARSWSAYSRHMHHISVASASSSAILTPPQLEAIPATRAVSHVCG